MAKLDKITIVIFFSIALLLSCNSNSDKSDKFLGTWESIDSQELTFDISKSGINFIMEGSLFGRNERTPASYNKDHDKLEVSNGMIKLDIIYDEKTKHILAGNTELQKAISIKENVLFGDWYGKVENGQVGIYTIEISNGVISCVPSSMDIKTKIPIYPNRLGDVSCYIKNNKLFLNLNSDFYYKLALENNIYNLIAFRNGKQIGVYTKNLETN